MKYLFMFSVWVGIVTLILAFLKGATYKGNLSEDANYYDKNK